MAKLSCILLLAIGLIACAKEQKKPVSEKATCTLIPDAQEFEYLDGSTRKSDAFSCTDSDGSVCHYARSLDGSGMAETSCEAEIETNW